MSRAALFGGMAVVGLVLVGADEPKGQPQPSVKPFVIPTRIFPHDAGWRGQPGAKAVIAYGGAPTCADLSAFVEMAKSVGANDRAGIDRLAASGSVIRAARGTPVVILQALKPERAARTMSLEEFTRNLGSGSPDTSGPVPVEVRFLAGPLEGKARFVMREHLGDAFYQGTPKKRLKGKDGAADAKARAPAPVDRGAILLNQARNLEKSRKIPAALDAYRRVAKDHPGTGAAAEAAERIRALGGK